MHTTETLKQIKKILIDLKSNKAGEAYKRERWVTIEEATVLYTILHIEEIQNYYESGTANGYSSSWATLAILQNGLIPNVHTWDLHNRNKIWEIHSVFKNFQKLIMFHNEPFIKAKKQNKLPSRSLYFIDGDHTRSGFREDFELVKKLAIKGDIILLHDIITSYEYIKKDFEKFSKDKRHKIIPTDRGMGIIWI